MGSDGTLQNASNDIHYFASSDPPKLKNLLTYHKNQTRLLSKIFKNIADGRLRKVKGDEQDELFSNDIQVAKRDIYRLERTLRGGSLPAWFQAEESQDELARIQRLLAPHESSELNKEKFNQRIIKAREKDDAAMKEEIETHIKKFQSDKRGLFQRPTTSYLDGLLPEVKKESGSDEAWQLFALKSLLTKFGTTPVAHLSRLMGVLDVYIKAKLDSIQPEGHQFPPLQLRIIRKPSGSIVSILFGSRSRDEIQSIYCPEIVQLEKLPILYMSKTHCNCRADEHENECQTCRREFLVAKKPLRKRVDSRKYVVWNNEPGFEDIYLVEKMGDDPFILVTLLGPDGISSDVTIPLQRDSRAVKDAICPPSVSPWIAEDGWADFGMKSLQCNSRYLLNYNHQIFVPGPPPPGRA
ncbi:hypothetical protein C8R44DRAFT_149079 [Mycena epipterygia]|nr:hypothetical protein C8R44DRAFT_149079 [Mycena epipterygia]